MNEIIDEQQRMLENGFTIDEADEFAQSESDRMRKNGFSAEEVNAAFGIMPFDKKRGEDELSKNLEKNLPEFGDRHDPSQGKKGLGYLGIIKGDDGRDMTEFSIGLQINGEEMDVPSMVPGLTDDELASIKAGKVTDSIAGKAKAHAEKRLKEGRSVYADETDIEFNSREFNKNLKETSGQPDFNKGVPGLPKFDPNVTGYDPILHAGTEGFPRPAVSFADYYEAGTGMSIEDLKKGKRPDVYVPENAEFIKSIAAMAGTMKGDIEGYLYGAALGMITGAPISHPIAKGAHVMGMVGAVTEGMKAYYVDQIQNGSITNGREFSDRIGGILLDSFKGYVTFGAAGAAGGVTGRFLTRTSSKFGPVQPHLQSKTGSFLATSAAEVATLVTVGNALEGQLPDLEQFAQAATLIFGLKTGAKIGSKAFDYGANLFKKKGVDPFTWAREAESDITVYQDSLSSNRDVPLKFMEPGSRVSADIVDPKVARIEAEMRKYASTGKDTVPQVQAELRADLKKEGFTEEQIETQIAEATQAASDRVTDHTIDPAAQELFQKNVISSIRKDAPAGNTTATKFDKEGNVIDEVSAPPPQKPVPPPPARGASKPGDIDNARDNILNKIHFGDQPNRPLTVEKFYSAALDDLHPMNTDVHKIVKDIVSLPVAKNTYALGRIYRGILAKAHNFLEYGPVDFNNLQRVGPGLRQILEPIEGNAKATEDWLAYALGKDAIDSMAKGVDTGLDINSARVFTQDKANIAKYEAMNKQVVNYQNQVAKYVADAGVISQKGLDWMIKNNPNHMPMFRLLDPGEWSGISKHGQIKNPFQKRKGSDKLINNPYESLIKNTYALVALADRNAVGTSYIKMANESGTPEQYYKKVKTPVKPVKITDAEMKKFLKENGMDDAPVDLMTVWRSERTPLRDNEIAVFENGVRNVYEVRPEIAEAFKNLDRKSAEWLIQILSVPARSLREGTVITPDFIFRNILRDQPLAFAMSKAHYIPVLDMAKGMLSIIKKDKDFHNFILGGGANSALVAIDRLYIQGEISKLARGTGIFNKTWNVVSSPLQILGIFSEIMENATRIGEFKKVQRKFSKAEAKRLGIKYDPDAPASKAAIQEGGFAGREVSVDFQRRGSKMYALSKMAAFFNPHLQGLDKLGRELKNNPVGTSAKLFLAVTLPSIILWINNHEDERYADIPRWEKDMYWIVMTDDTIYRIPKSHEAGIIFGSLPERLLDKYFGENPDAFKGFRDTVFNSLISAPLPTAGMPLIDQFSNRSTFTGQPIIPSSMEHLMPEYQYKPYTTELTKEIARVFGALPKLDDKEVGGLERMAIEEPEGSFPGAVARALTTPILIDNYLRSWTGGMGLYVRDLIDKALREADLLPNPVKREDTLADIPFIRSFVVRHPSASNQHIQDFYTAYNKRMTTFATLRMLEKEGDFEAEDRILRYDPDAEDNLIDTKTTLSDLSADIRDLVKLGEDGSIPRDQLGQMIDEMYYDMIQVAKDANEDMRLMELSDKEYDKQRGNKSIVPLPVKGGNSPSKTIPQEGGGSPFPQPGSPLQNEMGAQ